MFLWNYTGEDSSIINDPYAQASVQSSTGEYYDETRTIRYTINDKAWLITVPDGINERDGMLLYVLLNFPYLKNYIDMADRERLMRPVFEEEKIEIPVEEEPYIEEAPEDNDVNVIQCSKCNFFYDSNAYEKCPFCPEEAEESDEPATVIQTQATPASAALSVNGNTYATTDIADGQIITVGRSPECSLAYTDEKQLSRVHCEIQYSDAEKAFYVTDRSLNGVFDSNGNRLVKDVAIKIAAPNTLFVANKAITLSLIAAENAQEVRYAEPENDEPDEQYQPQNEAQPVSCICPNCNGAYSADATFCPWCGARVAQPESYPYNNPVNLSNINLENDAPDFIKN